MAYTNYVSYTDYFIEIIIIVFCRYDGISCTNWSGAEASMADTMPLITARSRRGMLVRSVPILSSLCCLINLLGFCLSFTRFESLDLPLLPDDRSQFDVHCALEDYKVKQFECLRWMYIKLSLWFLLLYPWKQLYLLCILLQYILFISQSMELCTPLMLNCSSCAWSSG